MYIRKFKLTINKTEIKTIISNNLNALIVAIILSLIISSIYEVLPDSANYRSIYQGVSRGFYDTYVERGFLFICHLSNLCRIDFNTFIFIYIFVCLYLIFIGIRKFTKNSGLIIFCYFLYPGLGDPAQIRNFTIVAIFTFAARYLMERNLKNIIKYCICIYIATLFHNIAYAYFLFLLCYLDMKTIKKYIVIGCALFLALIYSNVFENILIQMNDKYSGYFTSESSGFKGYIMALILLVIIILGYYTLIRNANSFSKNELCLLKIVFISIVFLVILASLGIEYLRLNRNLMVFYYCSLYQILDINIRKIRIKDKYLTLINLAIPISLFLTMDLSKQLYLDAINYLIK